MSPTEALYIFLLLSAYGAFIALLLYLSDKAVKREFKKIDDTLDRCFEKVDKLKQHAKDEYAKGYDKGYNEGVTDAKQGKIYG